MSDVNIGSMKQVGIIRNDEAVAAVCNNVLKTSHRRTSRKCSKSIAFRGIVSYWIPAFN